MNNYLFTKVDGFLCMLKTHTNNIKVFPAAMRAPHVARQARDRLSKVVTELGLEGANNIGQWKRTGRRAA